MRITIQFDALKNGVLNYETIIRLRFNSKCQVYNAEMIYFDRSVKFNPFLSSSSANQFDSVHHFQNSMRIFANVDFLVPSIRFRE